MRNGYACDGIEYCTMIRPAVLTESVISSAERYISRADEVMSSLIHRNGPCRLLAHKFPPFHVLTSAIIRQQLSAKAADTIEGRVADITTTPFSAKRMFTADELRLRQCGLSARKASFIKSLASRVMQGKLDLKELSQLDNEAAIQSLIASPGIGRWTAEMFLIFALKRPDVLSVSDAGLKRAIRLLYGDSAELAVLSVCWRPFTTVASWHLWHFLDN